MKKLILMLALLTSAGVATYAQSSNSRQDPFEVSADNFRRQYFFDLGNGNKAEIKLTEKSNLDYLKNLDSLIRTVVDDLTPFKDSLSNPLASKRILYLMDAPDIVKIRIQTFPPSSVNDYVKSNGVTASLKITQDSLVITGSVGGRYRKSFFPLRPVYDYYQVSFYLNDITDLAGYMDGRLNKKVAVLHDNLNKVWLAKKGKVHIKTDSTITAVADRGNIGTGNLYIARFSIDIQNYKNHFIPSTTLAAGIVSSHNLKRREFSLGTEFHFPFSTDSSGKTHSNPNLFLTLSYGIARIDPKASKTSIGSVSLYPYISISYLIQRKGDLFDKHSFKIGMGRFSLFGGSTKVEPSFYFNHFLRTLTPSFRIVQQF